MIADTNVITVSPQAIITQLKDITENSTAVSAGDLAKHSGLNTSNQVLRHALTLTWEQLEKEKESEKENKRMKGNDGLNPVGQRSTLEDATGDDFVPPIQVVVLSMSPINGSYAYEFLCTLENGEHWTLRRSYQDYQAFRIRMATIWPESQFFVSMDAYFECLLQQPTHIVRNYIVINFMTPRADDDVRSAASSEEGCGAHILSFRRGQIYEALKKDGDING